jgi:hexosaminidase
LTESQCIITQLGSEPNSTGGWYSTDDYKAILKYAEERHVKVIPEFDMPGHAHAAIAAMLARYRATNDDTYLLSDLGDTSEYM